MAPAGAVFYGIYDMLKHNHLARRADIQGQGTVVPGVSSPAAAAADVATTTATAKQAPTLEPMYTLLYGAMAGGKGERSQVTLQAQGH